MLGTCEFLGEFLCKEDVGEFALSVRGARVVGHVTVEVCEVNGAALVSDARHGHDASAAAALTDKQTTLFNRVRLKKLMNSYLGLLIIIVIGVYQHFGRCGDVASNLRLQKLLNM